jgi:ABC-2 type transport system permease protein
MHTVNALVRHNLRLVFRDFTPLLSYVIMPLLMMSVLKPMYVRALGPEANAIGQVAAGQAVMFSLFALGTAAAHVFRERDRRTLDRLRMTPVSGVQILVGKLVPLYLVLVAQQVLLLAYAVGLLGLDLGPRPFLVAAVTLTWAAALLTCAAALGLTVQTNGQLDAAKDLGAIVFSLLGGALVPHAILPGWLPQMAGISPAYWAISAYRAALSGDGMAVLGWLAVLVALMLAGGAFAAWRTTRGALSPTR